MKRMLFIVIFVFIFLSVNGYAYNITAEGHYCHNCTDCINATNNITNPTNTTYLNRSITDWGSSCIDNPENFSDSIFDCQGYTIDSDGLTGSTAGIKMISKNNITIRNCIITDFNVYGIYTDLSANGTIQNNTITATGNFYGMNIYRTEDFTIFNNTIVITGGPGIRLYINSLRNNITNNTFLYNSVAVYIDQANNNNIVNNTIRYSVCDGINLAEGSDNLISGNTIDFSGDEGIAFSNSGITTIEYNIINNSGDYGIDFNVMGNNIVRNNTIINSTNNDIYMWLGGSNTLYNMTFGPNSSSLVNFSAAVTDVGIKTVSTVAATPTGYVSLGSYLNITGAALMAPAVALNLSYDPNVETVGSNIGIYKYVAPDWVNVSNDALYEDDKYVSVAFTLGTSTTFIYGIFEDPPPLRSGRSPSGTLTAGTATLYLETDENATCRYENLEGTAYTAMTSTNTDWGTIHTWSLTSLTNGVYNYYIRCNDTAGNYNANDYPINFSVLITRPYTGGMPPAPTSPEDSSADTVSDGGSGTSDQEENTEEPQPDIFDILPKEITLPLITQFGAPITIMQISFVSITNYMAGREIIFIDVLPIFDLLGAGKLDFNYLFPIMKII